MIAIGHYIFKRLLCVNLGKTKVIICGKGLDTIKPSGKYPCSVCRKGAGRNSIFCKSWDAWVHKKCSGIKKKVGLLRYQISSVTDVQAQHTLSMVGLLNMFDLEIKNQMQQNPLFTLEMKFPQMGVVRLAPLQESTLPGESFVS